MAAEHADTHPIVVYSLADVPLPLRANIRPDSPLFGCCFYSATGGPTLKAGIAKAFELVPEPPCDEVEEGMRIAGAIADALQKTFVSAILFATRSHEEATKDLRGFHTGEAARFRRALEEAGLTLVEGAEVFRDLLRFVVSDAAIVKRVTHGETLSFTEAHVVLPPEQEGAPRLSAIMGPPESWHCSLVGMDGGVVDLRSVRFDDTQPIHFPPRSNATPADEAPGADRDAEPSPRWASARLAGNEPSGEEGASLLRTMAEHAVKLSPDQVLAVVRVWARYLLSEHVTGRMGFFGEAFLAGLSALVGDAQIRRIIADEGRRLRGESGPLAHLEPWIDLTVRHLLTERPDMDPARADEIRNDLRRQAEPLLDTDRMARGLALEWKTARSVVDRLVQSYGWPEIRTEQARGCTEVTWQVDAERRFHLVTNDLYGAAYCTFSGPDAIRLIFIVSVRFSFLDLDDLKDAARRASTDAERCRAVWMLAVGSTQPDDFVVSFVRRQLSFDAPDVRRAGVEAAAITRWPVFAPLLEAAARDADADVREAAAFHVARQPT